MKNMDLQIFAEPNVPSNPITPEINYETEAFINTSPAEGQPTWASLANLTTNMAQSLNEDHSTAYLLRRQRLGIQ